MSHRPDLDVEWHRRATADAIAAVEKARKGRAKDKTPRGPPLAERTDHLGEDEERERAERGR